MTPRRARDRETPALAEFGEALAPHEAAEPILAKPVRDALTEWLTEIWAAEELEAAGLKPRERALFHGPPGVGKTTLAHHLAARLGLTLIAVRPDRLIDSYIGSTGRNFGALFDAARDEGPVALLIDEFDAVAQKRLAARQGAEQERNSSLNTLLQRLDAHRGIVIAATNHPDELDPAIWRRFDIQIALRLPGEGERRRILARYLAPYALPAPALKALAECTANGSPALLRQLCEGLKRNLVIGPRVGWPMEREAVIARVVAAVAPPPGQPVPPLWSAGGRHPAVAALPWPFEKETPDA